MAVNNEETSENHDEVANPSNSTPLKRRGTTTKETNGVPLVMVGDATSHVSTPLSPRSSQARRASESSEADHSPNRKSLLGYNKFQPDDGHSFSDCGLLDDNNLPILPDNNSDFQSNFSINELAGGQMRGDIIVNQLPTPPDGGYGWVIVGAAFACNFIVDGVANSFGPFMSSYQQAFNSTKAATSIIGSLLIGMYLLSGPVSGALLNNYEARKVVIAGTLLSSLAFALSTFSPNIFVHYLLYGVFGGIGFGFIYLPAIVIVSQYFEAKRALATGLSVAGSGLGTFLIPLFSKFCIETFGWRSALYGIAIGVLLICAVCGALFRPLPMPAFDLEKQNKLNEELKQQALLAALQQVESDSNLSDEDGAHTGGGISPPRRSGATRTSSECTDGQPLLSIEAGMEKNSANDNAEDNNADADSSPIMPHNRPPLSPIPEGVTRRPSKKRAGSQHQTGTTTATTQYHQAGESGVLGRHPTMLSSRTRKPTLASVNSDWMGSNGQLRQSRANLCSQLSRVSARSYAQSLSRISQAPAQSIKAGESVLSVAMSGIEPKEFARPLSRHDIFLQGSIRNLKEFESEGNNYQRYRESQISIPLATAAQNISSTMSHIGGIVGGVGGDIAESSFRFGGSQYSRITGAFGVGDLEELEAPIDDSKFKWIPFPIRHAFSQMIDVTLLLDPVMFLICVCNILAMLGFYVPFVYLIDLATAKGISASEATFLLSFIGIANTLGRVFFGWVADRRWVTAIAITNCSLVSCGLLTAICPLLPNYPLLIAYACLFGFIVAAYVCLTSIVLSDLLGVERLTNSFGLVVVSRGVSSLLGTPIAGIVYDVSASYNASFYFAGTLILLSGMVSCLIPMVHRHQRSQLKNEGDYVDDQLMKKPIAAATDQQDAQSGKLSVLTEHSEENLTEYQRTIQSINQQRALMHEMDEYKKRSQRVDEDHEDEVALDDGKGGDDEQPQDGSQNEPLITESEGRHQELPDETEDKTEEADKEKVLKQWDGATAINGDAIHFQQAVN